MGQLKRYTLKKIAPLEASLLVGALVFGFGLVNSVAVTFVQILLTPLTFQWKLIGMAVVVNPLIGGLAAFVACVCYNTVARVIGGIGIEVNVSNDT